MPRSISSSGLSLIVFGTSFKSSFSSPSSIFIFLSFTRSSASSFSSELACKSFLFSGRQSCGSCFTVLYMSFSIFLFFSAGGSWSLNSSFLSLFLSFLKILIFFSNSSSFLFSSCVSVFHSSNSFSPSFVVSLGRAQRLYSDLLFNKLCSLHSCWISTDSVTCRSNALLHPCLILIPNFRSAKLSPSWQSRKCLRMWLLGFNWRASLRCCFPRSWALLPVSPIYLKSLILEISSCMFFLFTSLSISSSPMVWYFSSISLFFLSSHVIHLVS